MEIKGLKILRDVKTQLLSMVSPLKHVMSKYRTLIQKMQEDSKDVTTPHASHEVANANFFIASRCVCSHCLIMFLTFA